MRRFEFYLAPTASNQAFFAAYHLNLILYAKEGSNYLELSRLDTSILGSIFTGNAGIQRDASATIVNFLSKGMAKQAAHSQALDWVSISKIDSLEKLDIPIYQATSYKDGLYYSFASFKNHTPDRTEFFIKKNRSDSSIIWVKQLNEEGKKRWPEMLYAVIDHGQIFIRTVKDFYPVIKRHDEFEFSGKVENIQMRGVGFEGVLTSIVFSAVMNKEYRLVIDHRTGEFVKLHRIKY